jgi:hypothetical protein
MDRCNWGTKYVPCTATRLDSAESRPAASSSCDDGWFLKSTGFPNHWSQHIHDFNCFHIFLGGYPVWSQPSTVLNEHILKSTYQQKERIFVGMSDVLSKLSKNKHINILLAVISFPDRFVQKKQIPQMVVLWGRWSAIKSWGALVSNKPIWPITTGHKLGYVPHDWTKPNPMKSIL